MKRAFRKNIFRTIKKSMGRYMAIFAIIALGVGFFSGLKASKPSMLYTAQDYLRERQMFDYRLISTWGFDQEEVEAIRALDGVAEAEGAVWEDFLYPDESGREICFKALSITESVNTLTLLSGRLPQADNECVLDGYRYSEDMIGTEITIGENNSSETRDAFVHDSYTVVGLVRSPLYMNMERGTTTIGNGKVEGFIFLPLSGFDYEYYKEVYVKTPLEALAFTEEYQDSIEDGAQELEDGSAAIADIRYNRELADAREEIADAREELADGEQELADAKKELEEKTGDARKELADAREELERGEQELADAQKILDDGKRELTAREQELADGESALADGEAQYQAGLTDYENGRSQYDAGYSQYQAGLAEYEKNLAQYQAFLAMLGGNTAGYEEQLAATEASLEQAKEQLDATGALLSATKNELDQGKAALDASRGQLDASRAQMEEGRRQIEAARKELATGQREIDDNQKKIADGWKEYEDGCSELEEEVADAEAEIADAEEELADGRQELADAEEELADVEEPELYVLDRNTNVGYACYENDISIVEGVAKIFPVFFFLIAALVCSTTMTRMVDDERTQIGTLRALGYTQGAILAKYAIYSGSAAGLGAIVGYLAGVRSFTTSIWTAYNMLYGFSELIIVDNIWLLLISLLVALICSVGTTYAACRLELKHAPAELIRPKAPPAGKRILLERVTLLWKHLKFLHKVSARNVFRFKKRMIMMILGISGCTALVVTGFGVKDSVTNIVNVQYDEILQYDLSATYSKELTFDILEEIKEEFGSEIETAASVMETSAEAPFEGGSKSVTLLVSDPQAALGDPVTDSINFHQEKDGSAVELPGDGEILIDNRLAGELSLEVGDTITLKVGDQEKPPLTVAGIFENYVYFYAYVNSATYEEYFGEAYEPKTLYLSLQKEADPYRISSYLSDMKDAAGVNVIADMRIRVQNIMQSMNFIIALVIGSAAALAFIVLFNLGNINISERVREIATLKVLGFYPRESGAYVFRESMVLSVMGIVVGLPLGVLLHTFVMSQLKVDMVSFHVQILPLSYVYSVVAVIGFTVCVDLIMRRKIERIDMAESLKSIE